MKIGIIGAENSHTVRIAEVLNINKKIKGCQVEYVWGETPKFAEEAAKAGKIPNIVRHPKEMLGKVDGVCVDHRHAKYHLPAVIPFIKAGIPTFVDKPFCYRAAEGKKFFKLAQKCKTPITSFSTIRLRKSFQDFKNKLKKIGTIGTAMCMCPADIKSKHGGVFFYGIHQLEMVIDAFGLDIQKVSTAKNGENALGILYYKSGIIVTLHFLKSNCQGFHLGATGNKGTVFQEILPGKDPYYLPTKIFTDMFKSGQEPFSYEKILKPIQVLEALEKSFKTGKTESVHK